MPRTYSRVADSRLGVAAEMQVWMRDDLGKARETLRASIRKHAGRQRDMAEDIGVPLPTMYQWLRQTGIAREPEAERQRVEGRFRLLDERPDEERGITHPAEKEG